jgi:thiol-disulfide isomerase/thioredoxin
LWGNSFHPDAKGISVKEFYEILIEEINRQNSLLAVFCETAEVSNEFKHWAQRDIRYSVSNYLLSYKFAHRNIEGDLFDESLFPVNDDNAIVASFYPLHLRHYSLNLGIWQDTATLNLIQSGENVDAYQRCLDKIIGTVEQGLSRDIMCYRLLLDLFDESFDDYKIVSKKNGLYIENEILKSVLFEKESEYQNQNALLDPEANEEEKIEGDFWKELKERYKGKVIYLDIWATWSGPCRIEVPHALKSHKYFEAEEEIAFVNLCLASNRNEWETMIQTNDIKGDNYFFNEPQTQLLRAKLQFEGYPTYMIVDKQGTIVNNNAPRPSSKEKIIKVLNEWVEKD